MRSNRTVSVKEAPIGVVSYFESSEGSIAHECSNHSASVERNDMTIDSGKCDWCREKVKLTPCVIEGRYLFCSWDHFRKWEEDQKLDNARSDSLEGGE